MNEPSTDVEGKEAEKPQDEEDDEDGPDHAGSLRVGDQSLKFADFHGGGEKKEAGDVAGLNLEPDLRASSSSYACCIRVCRSGRAWGFASRKSATLRSDRQIASALVGALAWIGWTETKSG